MTAVQERLFALREEKNAAFVSKLIPDLDPATILGARTPALRRLAKELGREDMSPFMAALPHAYFEENALHAFLIGQIGDFERCLRETERFLPFIDNWATCDSLRPPVFRKHRAALLPHIRRWLDSGETYTVRFGLEMLLCHFLEEDFDPVCLDWAAAVKSGEYYVRMMQAWFFATALAGQYAATLPYLEQGRLERWTHNKTIQKAVESRRITPEQKTYLKTLKRKDTEG